MAGEGSPETRRPRGDGMRRAHGGNTTEHHGTPRAMEHRGPMIGHSLSRHVIEIGSNQTGPERGRRLAPSGGSEEIQPTGWGIPGNSPGGGIDPRRTCGIRGVVIIGWCSAQVSRTATLGRNAARRRWNNGRDAELRTSPAPGWPPGRRRRAEPCRPVATGRAGSPPSGSARGRPARGYHTKWCHGCPALPRLPCEALPRSAVPAVRSPDGARGWVRQPLSLRCSAARQAPRARSTGRPEAVPRTSGSARGSAGPPVSTPRRPP
ncbi:hypothetical protein ALLO2DRAFT_00936 [Frankia sp. Allo2]|nr:hypothetical protein BMG523Draft_00585 [Frankia sp. BMG5.23]KFB06408.1 hypothetical protein ALLO2DRAFT_00936 [Frankia sp. Allo2]OAA26286.1 hypothetical protein AAY23_103260 [Frankia casuarinae]